MRHAFRIPQSEFRIRADAVERYMYDPYGEVNVLDADFSSDADGESDYDNAILYCGYYHDTETGLYHVRWRVLPPPPRSHPFCWVCFAWPGIDVAAWPHRPSLCQQGAALAPP